MKAVYGIEEFFDGWQTAAWVKALAGGLVVGLIGAFGSPHIFGVGHEGVELALAGALTVGTMVGLVVLKILATSITLGAGGSGGVFAPALFIGAMTGGAFGQVVARLAPTVTAPSGAYALVGSAAVFGAATHAPLTAIVIIFEMTGDYQIILPLMFAVVLAQLIASRINPDSIYSIKLRRLGGAFGSHTERGTLDFLLVADAMTDRIPSVAPDSGLEEFAAIARRTTDTRSWVVLERGDTVVGMVTLKDLEHAILESSLEDRTVADIMTTGLVTCNPGETLGEAFRRFAGRDVFQIPVLDPDEPGKIVGMLRRSEMLWAFKQLSDEHERLLERLEARTDQPRSSSAYVELPVRPEHRRLCFHRIRELGLPEFALVAPSASGRTRGRTAWIHARRARRHTHPYHHSGAPARARALGNRTLREPRRRLADRLLVGQLHEASSMASGSCPTGSGEWWCLLPTISSGYRKPSEPRDRPSRATRDPEGTSRARIGLGSSDDCVFSRHPTAMKINWSSEKSGCSVPIGSFISKV